MSIPKFLKRLLVPGGLALVGLSGMAARAQGTAVDYWPMKVGNTWTIDTLANGKTITQVLTVLKRTPAPGGAINATIEYRFGDKVLQSEVYRVDAKGFSRTSSGMDGASVITPPIQIVKYPVVYGATWSWSGSITVGSQTFQGMADLSAVGSESVNTPAGSFEALHIHMDLAILGPNGEKTRFPNDYWFAPGVGMVKQSAQIGESFITGVVTSYSLQK